MDNHPITLERTELYEKVWTKPMTKLAKEYKLSDVALAKTCRKANIPLPGRGYWAKVAAGRKLKPAPLPALPLQSATQISIGDQKSRYLKSLPFKYTEEDLEKRNDLGPPIQVPSRLGKLHPLLEQMRPGFEKAKPDKYHALWCPELSALNLRVSKDSLSRAFRILNALYLALEERGYPITLPRKERAKVAVTVFGESIEFGIEERFRRIEPKPHDPEKLSWWNRERVQFQVTGILTLKIMAFTWGTHLQKIWSDGKRQTVEDLLNPFILGLLQVAQWEKAERLKREREHQERLETDERRKAIEQKRLEEEAKRRRLEREAANWHQAQQIRRYLAALKDSVNHRGENRESNSKIQEWFIWAHQYADQLDPISASQRVFPVSP